MNLFQIVTKIKELALRQPNVNQCWEGSVFDINAAQSIKYSTFVISQDSHTEYDGWMNFRFNLYYVDRLKSGEDNRLQIQSIGIEVLRNVIHVLQNEEWIDDEMVEYHTFTQQFNDVCAGAFANVTFSLPLDECTLEGIDYYPPTPPPPPPPAANPLCITALEDMTIELAKAGSPYPVELEISHDEENWQDYSFGTVISLTEGGKVYFRNKSEETVNFTKSLYFSYFFRGEGRFAVSGNIMTLVKHDGDEHEIPNNCCFNLLFSNTQVVDASELELPATVLKAECYANMFQYCTSLTTAPVLPAPTLKTSSYSHMFEGCTALNSVQSMATDISAENCTYDWLDAVGGETTGTFVKKAGVEWPTGSSGIPEGWTVEEV